MPTCSECRKTLERSDFSKVQLRKKAAIRRCKACTGRQEQPSRIASVGNGTTRGAPQQTHHNIRREIRPLEPQPPIRISNELKRMIGTLIGNAVPIILSRGIPQNIGFPGNFGPSEIETRLWEVLDNHGMLWLTYPLLVGLSQPGSNDINERVPMHGMENFEAYPILHHLVQFKNYKAQLSYAGAEDIVALALAAGAKPNATISNKCTALNFAVKYGSALTVQLLLDNGACCNQRDWHGYTIWKNALERPMLEVIEILIERCNEIIPVADEVIPIRQSEDGDPICGLTLPDQMLYTLSCCIESNEGGEIPMSWRILGLPSIEDVATSLVRIMQAGAFFSSTKENFPKILDALSLVVHMESERVSKDNLHDDRTELILQLRDVIFGTWLPEALTREVQEIQYKAPANVTCLICLTDMEESDHPITLYCGHRYCAKCIMGYGHVAVDPQRPQEKRCPACRRLLCRELLSDEYISRYRSFKTPFGFLGLVRHEASSDRAGDFRRPSMLSDDQLRFECDARGFIESTSRRDLLEKIETGSFLSRSSLPEMTLLELSATSSLSSTFGGNPVLFVAPKNGPVVIPITVKGISVLAWLSPYSALTILSNRFVETFGLKVKKLSSSNLLFDAYGNKCPRGSVVDEFVFKLEGGIEVCLNNAVTFDGLPTYQGVQLGMDFFGSALWTQCCTSVDMCLNEHERSRNDDVYLISDGSGAKSTQIVEGKQADELRYYSRDGKSCRIPFIHIQNFGQCEKILMTTLRASSQKFGECQWCCRCFPYEGMLSCPGCHQTRLVLYCDEECRSQAAIVHRHKT